MNNYYLEWNLIKNDLIIGGNLKINRNVKSAGNGKRAKEGLLIKSAEYLIFLYGFLKAEFKIYISKK